MHYAILKKIHSLKILFVSSLQISVTTSCVQTMQQTEDVKDIDRRTKMHLSKRNSEVTVETYPLDFTDKKRPKVIYRKISKQRYRASKPKYGAPKPKYGVPKKTTPKQPYKKYKVKKVNPKFKPSPSKNSRAKKLRRQRPSPSRPKPKFNMKQQASQPPIYFSDATGFGEPPQLQMAPHEFEYKKPPQSLYAEPPVDSYGTPLKTPVSETFAPNIEEEYIDATVSYSNNHEQSGGLPKYRRWHDFAVNHDNNYSHSIKQQTALVGSKIVDDNDDDEDININSYSDFFRYNANKPGSSYDNHKFSSNELIQNSKKYLNKPWKVSSSSNEDHDQIVVGGQYAEPPGRVVPSPKVNPSIYFDEYQIFSGLLKPETATAATMSSYVNYKHSNMAFSPQNLNDAFGIVEK